MSFALSWLDEVREIALKLSAEAIEDLVNALEAVRERDGRVFVLGLGGSAANASHCVNDLRTRAGIEAYAPTDNVAELTATCNDYEDGWEQCFVMWLERSELDENDAVLVLSGSGESQSLVEACKCASDAEADIFGILGRPDSTIGRYCDISVVVPAPEEHRAGHAEAFQAVVWHCIVAHPTLAQ